MVSPKISLPDLSGAIATIEADANRLPKIAEEVINETTEYMAEEMRKEYDKKIKQDTGESRKAIKSEAAKTNGDIITGKVGLLYIRGKDEKGFHAVYLENGTPKMAARPFVRPIVDRKKDIASFQKQRLRAKGIPIE